MNSYNQSMKSTVSEKGQITIPKALRDRLGLAPGTELEFFEDNGKLVGRRILTSDPFQALVGMLPRIDVDESIVAMRGPAWNADDDARA